MDIRDMALYAIEFLSSSEGEPSQDLIDNIYKIAHSALGECQGNHDDWIELTKKVYAEGTLQGYCARSRKEIENFEKTIASFHSQRNKIEA